MIKVNLVPAEILAKAKQKQQVLQASVAGVVLGVVVLAMSTFHIIQLKTLEREYAVQEREFKRLSAIVAKVEEIEKTASAVRARLNVITDLLKGRQTYPVFMSDFVRSVPAGIRVRGLNTQGGSVNPIKLIINAEARSNEDIAAWVKNMETAGKFSAIEIGAVSAADTAEARVFNFSLTTLYTPKL